ncbi:MAG: hypothetical protein NWF07_11835 [Candidatus Bathyarchaeota archaeon]|nr:hypothetical protein [Candidatus Bathyarchaeota archaeon]
MVELSLIRDFLACFGVIAGFSYYVLTVRASQNNMRRTLETRQISLIDNIVTRSMGEHGFRNFFELMRYEWTDYADFEKKYGSENNVEATAKRFAVWQDYNLIGLMLRKGLVESDDLFDMGVQGVIFLWEKYRPIIEEERNRYLGQNFLKDFEYLAGEMLKVVQKRESTYVVPETLDKYVPDP